MKEKKDRLPPGQIVTHDFPVLHAGDIPAFDENSWSFKLTGLVEEEICLSYAQFLALPMAQVIADFHCVTSWSRFDNLWEGALAKTIAALARPRPEAKYVLIHCEQGYAANLPIDDFLRDNVLFARRWGGADLTPEHGFPLRLVVPHLYAWKSAKWARGVEFVDKNIRGFWESRGYHIHGDPWREERYSSAE